MAAMSMTTTTAMAMAMTTTATVWYFQGNHFITTGMAATMSAPMSASMSATMSTSASAGFDNVDYSWSRRMAAMTAAVTMIAATANYLNEYIRVCSNNFV